MPGIIGIRNETKSRWERRAPLTPDLVRKLVHDHDLQVLIQPSARRVFPDGDYLRAGAKVTSDLSEATAIFGVKEIPPELLQPRSAYIFFSHVIKGQPHNMPTLKRLMDLECTLIDYEKVADDRGRRLIFFGRFAGLAGMIDTLWALGRRYSAQGIATPLDHLEPAHTYASLEEAKAALSDTAAQIASVGFPPSVAPVVVGVAGYGNVAKGAQEILGLLPHHTLTPSDLANLDREPGAADRHRLFVTTFKERDLVEPVDSETPFELQHYYDHPEGYRSRFRQFLPVLSVLVNANYWDERYPRLISLEDLDWLYGQRRGGRLEVIGDLGCDIGGTIECTLKCTDPSDPVFTWDPNTRTIRSGFTGPGPSVLAVDFLPTELPLEASEEFAATLGRFADAIGKADFDADFDSLELPSEIKRAVIVHKGRLTESYRYLEEFVAGVPGDGSQIV